MVAELLLISRRFVLSHRLLHTLGIRLQLFFQCITFKCWLFQEIAKVDSYYSVLAQILIYNLLYTNDPSLEKSTIVIFFNQLIILYSTYRLQDANTHLRQKGYGGKTSECRVSRDNKPTAAKKENNVAQNC
jgi:hypothetical protein